MKLFRSKTFIAAIMLGSACFATPVLANSGFDPANVILANAGDQPMTLPAPAVSEQEAKLWVLNAGYNQVSGLTRDSHALYRGTAMLNGDTYDIVVDNQGNIVGSKD